MDDTMDDTRCTMDGTMDNKSSEVTCAAMIIRLHAQCLVPAPDSPPVGGAQS